MSHRFLGEQFYTSPTVPGGSVRLPVGKTGKSDFATDLGAQRKQKAYIDSVMQNAELGQDGINKPLPKNTRLP
jgi:hypothetical protein